MGLILTRVCLQHVWPLFPDFAAAMVAADFEEQIQGMAVARIETAIIMDSVETDV